MSNHINRTANYLRELTDSRHMAFSAIAEIICEPMLDRIEELETEQWHCQQLPGARVVCEREDLLARIAELEAELERTRQAWAHGDDPMCEDVCTVACKGPCGVAS